MKVKVMKRAFSRIDPKMRVVCIKVEGLDLITHLRESKHLLQEAVDLVQLTFNRDSVKSHDLISPWAAAQAEFGEKAHHYTTSVEKLLYKVLNKKSITTQNVLTNILQYLSLKHIVPVGIDDIAKIEGKMTFDVAPQKTRVRLLRDLKKNELYYHDEKGILGMKLDYWKSPRTKVRESTTSVLIHFELLASITKGKADEIVREAEALLENFCGARVETAILRKGKTSCEL